MKFSIKSVVLAVSLAFAATAFAQNNGGQISVNLAGGNGVTYTGTVADSPTSTVAGFEMLANGSTFDLFVTTPDDILVVDFTIDVASGSIFQDTSTTNPYGALLGSNTGPAPLGAITNNPQLGGDSWVQTPGSGTACAQIAGACPGFEDVGQVSHFDSSGEGAQTDFNFGRITLIPDESGMGLATFTGFVQVANQPQPIVEAFSFTLTAGVPEPASMSLLMTALLGGLGLIRKRR